MKLSDEAYEGLSPLQRVRATFSAMGRGDAREVKRLVRTTPKRPVRESDPRFSDTMRALDLWALRTLATLSWLEDQAADLHEAFRGGTREEFEAKEGEVAEAFAWIATVAEAWRRVGVCLDIDPADFAKFGPPRHPRLVRVLEFVEGRHDEEEVADLVRVILDQLPAST